MKKLFLGVIALILSGCSDAYPDYNYKMTIHVGDNAYSTVREVTIEETDTILDSSGKRLKYGLRGEAVIIDSLDGSSAFALLSKPNDADYGRGVAEAALRPELTAEEEASADRDKIYYQRLSSIEGVHDLPKRVPNVAFESGYYETWPMFVEFEDIDDPKTVREISASALGVTNITIEITDDDVTTGIEGRLPWRKGFPEGKLNGQRFEDMRDKSLAAHLSAFSFSTESTK